MSERRKLTILLATLAGVLLSSLDGTVTSTAMPRIVAELHGGQTLTWVVTAYLLASTVTIPVYGRLADLYGRKTPLLAGLSLFLLGSALCATASSMGQLIGFRVLQGIGAGALLTVGMTLVRDLYPPHQSGGMLRMQTLMAGVMVVSLLGGPLAGGVITDTWGWEWIFLVNLPLGALALGVLARLVPRGVAADERGRFDFGGVALLALGISLVLVGLTTGAGLVLVLAGVAVLVWFVLVERSASVPVVPLRLFASRTYRAVTVAGFMFTGGMMPVGLFIGLYFQQVLGRSATESGLMVLPLMGGMIFGNRLTAVVALRTGRVKPLLAGGAGLLAAGSAPLAFLDAGIPVWVTLVCTGLIGIGVAPSMGGIAVVAQTAVDRRDVGSATAGLNLVKQLGGSSGLAVGQVLLSTQGVGWSVAVAGVVGGLLALGAVLTMADLDLAAARH